MKPFPQMTQDEQIDHLMHVHGVADAEELADSPDMDMDEAHTYQHGTFESDHENDPHEDDEAMTDRYIEIARPPHDCNPAHRRIWHDGDVQLEEVPDATT